jgi:hypothetical protein
MGTPLKVEGPVLFRERLLSIEFLNKNNVSVWDIDLERVRDKRTLQTYLDHKIAPGYMPLFLAELDRACMKVFDLTWREAFAEGNRLDWRDGTLERSSK